MGGKEDPFSSCSLQKWNPAKPIGQDQPQPPSCLVTKPKFDRGRVRKSNSPQLFKREFTEESRGGGEMAGDRREAAALNSTLPEQSSS